MPTFRDFAALVRLDPETLREKVNQIMQGKLNTVSEVTLMANVNSSEIMDDLVSPDSAIALTPLTATAAAETWWISMQGDKKYTVMHTNNALTDRTFRVNVIG